MEILIIISFTIVFFTTIITKKKLYHPIILFNGIWLIIFMLYNIQLIEFIQISNRTILILLFMIISFPMGVFIGERISKRKKDENQKQTSYTLRTKLFLFICLVTIFKMFYDERDIIMNVLSGVSFHTIMAQTAGKGTVLIQGFSVALYIFFIYPCMYFISPICANIFFTEKNKTKIYYLLLNLSVVFLSVMHHGGRNSIFLFIICYGITYLMQQKKIYIKRKTKIFIILGLVMAFLVINNISSSRGINNIEKSFYAYFTCSIPLSELYLSMPVIKSASLGGYLSFNGFITPIVTVLKYFGITPSNNYQLAYSVKEIIEYNYLSIGNYALNMNAFLPAGTYLYIDGGYIYEIIGMIAYGIFAGYVFSLTQKTNNNKFNVLYVLLSISFILSFIRFYFTTVNFSLAILYLITLYKKDNSMKEGKNHVKK